MREKLGDAIAFYGVIPCLFVGCIYPPAFLGAAAAAIVVMIVNPDSMNPF